MTLDKLARLCLTIAGSTSLAAFTYLEINPTLDMEEMVSFCLRFATLVVIFLAVLRLEKPAENSRKAADELRKTREYLERIYGIPADSTYPESRPRKTPYP